VRFDFTNVHLPPLSAAIVQQPRPVLHQIADWIGIRDDTHPPANSECTANAPHYDHISKYIILSIHERSGTGR
jgi:hypothetical protein